MKWCSICSIRTEEPVFDLRSSLQELGISEKLAHCSCVTDLRTRAQRRAKKKAITVLQAAMELIK